MKKVAIAISCAAVLCAISSASIAAPKYIDVRLEKTQLAKTLSAKANSDRTKGTQLIKRADMETKLVSKLNSPNSTAQEIGSAVASWILGGIAFGEAVGPAS